ncbi:MAG TPA: glycosyltransferase family 4 protein [Longimicrobiaceae bacterium]|nr:glycosyltransferase family 4 protein [Longimicrobiaceae bacterium]
MTLRVLHCIYDDPANPWVAGGGSVRVLELYRRLVGRLGSVTVATGSFPGARDETMDGIRYRRLGASWPYAWSRFTYSLAASRLLDRGDYDVAVYDFSTYTPLRLPTDRPVGVTVHHITGTTATERWGGTIGRMVARQELRRLRRGRFFSATSRATQERLRLVLGPGVEIRLIEAGVPDELFELPRRESDYLLYFGRLDWFQKGLDVLLEAVRILAGRHRGLRLKIAGRGKDRDRLLERAYTLGIRENVEVIGPVGDDERNALLSGARILVMPSRFEGFGMVAAEAMAAGVPVVASDAGSLPEVIDPPRGGEIVPVEDPRALAGRIEALLDDPRRRRALSRSARRSAERFRWQRIADQHLEFLEAIHAAGRPVPQET